MRRKLDGSADADEIAEVQNIISMVAAALVAGTALLLAQWPKHPTDGPMTESGELDLKAPAPKAPDGHPDLSGPRAPNNR